jgi:predicted dehydrogenase
MPEEAPVDTIGVGVIGASPDHSWAAFSHLPALAVLPEYELRAVSTSRPESAQAAGSSLGVPGFHDHVALVNYPGVDLVVVSVRVARHRELVLAALEAGKHVLCEWPLGNGLDETLELADAARERDMVAVVGLQGQFSPALNRARDLIADGYVGDVLSTTLVASCWVYGGSIAPNNAYMTDIANGANLMTVQTGHVLDAVASCVGELSEVAASIATVRPDVEVEGTAEVRRATTPDQIAIHGRLESGGTASVHIRGGRFRGTNMLWEINGTEGDLVIRGDGAHINNDDGGEPTLHGGRGDEARIEPLPIPPEYRWVPPETPAGPPYNVAQLYRRLASDIREGTACCPTFDHAVARHRLVAAIQTAAETGTRQTFDAALA